ncbi:MAG: FkbM family methyltransferase [bacterium]
MFLKRLNKAIHLIANYICKYRGKPFADIFGGIVDKFHRNINNENFNIEQNGELRILKIMTHFSPKCVFDVGANVGEWSKTISRQYPKCVVHAFEIVSSTYNELVNNTKDLKNVITNNFGLSNEEGVIAISLGRESSTATGCKIESMKFHDQYYNREIKCEIRKASDYLKERAIQVIDLLKIDVEGMDLKVIKGFGDQIKKVRVIQFEYGIFNIASHDLLYDYCRYFKQNGFIVGKIFPNYVYFFEYHFNMENFYGSNYLAVRNDEKEIIKKLSQFGA